jgi:autotransporter adhesin
MLSKKIPSSRIALLLSATLVWANPARADITLTPSTNGGDFAGTTVCSVLGGLYLSGDSGECDLDEAVFPDTLTFESGTELETLTGSIANFGGVVNFSSNNVQFNSSTVAFGGGSATFNNTVSFTGPSVTFDTLADFNNGVTTDTITNSGNISTNTLLATGIGAGNVLIGTALTVQPGASVDLGGNVIHGVAAGVADTDAVNVAQLNAATSGITTDITALETATATHTTQITELQDTAATQATEITAIETVNTTQATQITAIETVNTTQATQITAIETVNSTQATQITSINTQLAGIAADFAELQSGIDTLFDLRSRDRRDMKQGVAAAMSMAQAPMPSGPGRISYAINGATFRGEYAVGASLNYRLNTEAPVMFSVGASFAGNKNNGFRVGVAGEF